MHTTRKEDFSFGEICFCGENFFSVELTGVPREKKIIELTQELIEKKKILEPERRIVTESILLKAEEIQEKNLTFYFFNPTRPIDERGSNLSEIEAMYIANEMKGDPFALIYLNLLDEDNAFSKKYPSMSLYENNSDMYCFSSYFSNMASLEGLNITSTSVRRQSGYFPQPFWFCGIDEKVL
jgi:hypothetical protein